MPGGYKDDVFVPYDYGHFAVIYDTQAVKNPPASLKELVEGDSAQKIAIQDPRTSTPGLGLLLWVKSVYGDKAPEAWAKLRKRILTVTPGWSESYGLFTKGEVPMVLSYTTSPAYHMVAEKSDRYQAAAFRKGITSRSKCPAFSKRTAQGAGKAVSRFHTDIRFSGCHSRKQLDDAGCGNVGALARGIFQTRRAAEDLSDGSRRGGEEPQSLDRRMAFGHEHELRKRHARA